MYFLDQTQKLKWKPKNNISINETKKQMRVPPLWSGKADFVPELVIKTKDCHYSSISGWIHQEDITIINMLYT